MNMTSSGDQQPPAELTPDQILKRARNRDAAQRCPQKKKQWTQGMQKTVEQLEERNRVLENEVKSLRDKIWKMSELLFRHPEDPVIVGYVRTNRTTSSPPAAASTAGSSSTGAANAASMSSVMAATRAKC